MTPESRTLSPWHYATLLISATIGNILFVWPGHVVSAAGENAATSVLVIVAGVGGIGLVHHAWVHQHTPLAGSARVAVMAIAAPGLLIVGAIDVALTALLNQMLHTLFYADTPEWALMVPFLGIVMWGAVISLDGLGRLTQLWVPLGGALLAGVSSVALVNASHGQALWPGHLVVIPAIHGVAIMAYLAAPVAPTVVLLTPHINAPDRTIRQSFMAAAAVIGVTLVAIYALVILLVGPDAIPHLRWPLVYTLETITLDSTFFVSRVGLAVIFLWTAVVALAFSVHLRLSLQVVQQVRPSLPRWSPIILGLVYAIGIGVFRTPTASSHWIVDRMDPLACGYLVLETIGLGFWVVVHAAGHRRHRGMKS